MGTAPESELIEQDVQHCLEHATPFRTLRDGQVIIVEDGRECLAR